MYFHIYVNDDDDYDDCLFALFLNNILFVLCYDVLNLLIIVITHLTYTREDQCIILVA